MRPTARHNIFLSLNLSIARELQFVDLSLENTTLPEVRRACCSRTEAVAHPRAARVRLPCPSSPRPAFRRRRVLGWRAQLYGPGGFRFAASQRRGWLAQRAEIVRVAAWIGTKKN